MIEAFSAQLLTIDELRARMPHLRARQANLQGQIDAINTQAADRDAYLTLADDLEGFLAQLRGSADTATTGQRQRVLHLLVKDVLVGPEKITIRHRIPARGDSPATRPHDPEADTEGDHRAGYPLRWGREFTAAGLHVTIKSVASGVDAIPNLVNGSVDIDEGQWAADLAAEASGAVKLHALAAASAGGAGVQEVVVPAGSPVTTVAQLRGKTIAVNALNGLAVLLTDNVLASHGVPVKDVHYVVIAFPAMASALAAHQVDAAFIAEPSLSAAVDGVGAVPLFDVNQGAAQNFPISGYVVTRAWAAKYPKTAAAFVGALERGQQVAGTDRAAVEQALIPALHISKTTAAVMALGTFPLSVSPVALGRVADLMQSNGLLAKSVNTEALVKELVHQ